MHNSTSPRTPTAARQSFGKTLLKWSGIVFLTLLLFAGLLVSAFYWTALRTEQPVGFQAVRAVDADGKPFGLGIWYPTTAATSASWTGSFLMQVATNGNVAGTNLPLVVISHGTGGGIPSHADLAMALAAAGYVVAAPMHSDNHLDMSSVGTPAYFTGRSQQLRSTIDFMLNQWPGHAQVDANRIGAYGFSIGAFTVLTAAGAKPDLRGVAQYCKDHSEFVCDMLRQSNSFLLSPDLPADFDNFAKDQRIKAIVVAAPGLGFTFSGKDALADVSAPLQLWQGDKDINVPDATNAKVIRDVLGNRVEFHPVANAAHLSFLVPCGVLKMLPVCTDPAGFDRQQFHHTMNPLVVTFFDQQLAQP